MTSLRTFKSICASVLFAFCAFKSLASSPTPVLFAVDNSTTLTQDHLWIAGSITELNHQLQHNLSRNIDIRIYKFGDEKPRQVATNIDAIVKRLERDNKLSNNQASHSSFTTVIKRQIQPNTHIVLISDDAQIVQGLSPSIKAKNIKLHVIVNHPHITLSQQISNDLAENIAINDRQAFDQSYAQLSSEQRHGQLLKHFDPWFERLPLLQQLKYDAPKSYQQLKTQWLEQNNQAANPLVDLALQSGGTAWYLPNMPDNSKLLSDYLAMSLSKGAQFAKAHYQPYGENVSVTSNLGNERKHKGNLITFDATNDRIESWEWDFNADGTIDDHGPVVTTRFNRSGNHQVQLWSTFVNPANVRKMQVIHVKIDD